MTQNQLLVLGFFLECFLLIQIKIFNLINTNTLTLKVNCNETKHINFQIQAFKFI